MDRLRFAMVRFRRILAAPSDAVVLNSEMRIAAGCSELSAGAGSDYAEAIAERIAAKRDGWAFSAFELLLTFRAGVQGVGQAAVKVVDMEVDVNRRPVSFISPDVVGSLCRPGSRLLLDQADLRAAAFENGIGGDRPSDLRKAKRVTVEFQSLVEIRDINRYGIVHVCT